VEAWIMADDRTATFLNPKYPLVKCPFCLKVVDRSDNCYYCGAKFVYIDNNNKIETAEDIDGDSSSLEILLNSLNSLIGLNKVKTDVHSMINLVRIRGIKEERGINQSPMSLHLVFTGNPGTGKTTVARLLSQIYRKIGVLSKGHLVEVDRSSLVGRYLGETAAIVQEVISKAKGGVLFIDEAYSLTVNRHEHDYGFEAVDTLVKAMEDNRDDLIVIVAGYPDKMVEFLSSNPGLQSRFNKFVSFEDYNPNELSLIFENMCINEQIKISKEAVRIIHSHFEYIYSKRDMSFANGRDVRNYFENALVNQANRVSKIRNITDEDLTNLKVEDVIGIS
jgi:SpoVK/Ycf46/Vps4 family AAA+-type ATPase